ncbi:autotransporter domain-containing protein [Phenylobacterium sp.]|uniref:autotransporter outer membrane beta-barrel domain-containing protein n=1 Tax=Phenylobacterium sp. TaxID=1871053 RepID=UPI00301CC543
MKRLLVSAAVLPLLQAAAHAETKISTATTNPVRTATIADGQPDHITIEAAGSIAPTASGAAVTVDSSNAVTNAGAIKFDDVSDATGILITPGVAMAVVNAGTISLLEDYTATDADGDGDLDGPFAQGSGRFGIRATGGDSVIGDIINNGAISIEGVDSGAISVEMRLIGNLTSSGAITVVGDRGVGIRADSVSGDVTVTGAISVQGEGSVGVRTGAVDGGLVIQNTLIATGYRSTERATEAVRAKLDADDLKQGGSALRITGSVGRGVLLDRPPADTDADNADEDNDGVADAAEGTASVVSFGTAPAIDIGGPAPITLGAVGTGDLAYGFVNRGAVAGAGVNDGVSATALRIGPGVTVQGGLHNVTGATMSSQAYSAQATTVLITQDADVATLRNGGSITAAQSGGLHDARALVDLSGSLRLIETSGTLSAVVTPASGVTQTGRAIAADLTANTTGITLRQQKVNTTDAPAIVGEVLFGAGDDRLELLGGTLRGEMNFGAGADTLVIDGGATATGRIVDADGRLAVDVREGRLAVANTDTLTLTSLTLGEKAVLAVTLDPDNAATRFNVTGAASLATGAQVDVTLTGLSRGERSYQLVQAGSLAVDGSGLSLAGAPWLYQANLRADASAGALFVDLRPKTAAELGLNRSGAQAYGAVFDALDRNNALETAFLGAASQAGFDALYEQMLPDHSGGVMMSAAQVSSAVSSAVAQAGGSDTSGTGLWAQEVLFHIRRDARDAAGFKSQGFGFAAGADVDTGSGAVGANVSFVSADVRDRGAAAGEEITMSVLGAGLYWRLDGGPLQAAVRGGLGYVFLDGDRRLVAPDVELRTKADWNAWMAEAYAAVSYEVGLGAFYVRPELSLSYMRLAEDGYAETGGGTGFDLSVDKRTSDMLTGEALLALGWRFGDEVYFAPELKVGYAARLAGGPGKTTARFEGGPDFTLTPEDAFDGGVVARAGFRGGGSRFAYAVNGGATVDSDYTAYDVRATVRFQF